MLIANMTDLVSCFTVTSCNFQNHYTVADVHYATSQEVANVFHLLQYIGIMIYVIMLTRRESGALL